MTEFTCLNKACGFQKEYLNEDEPQVCPDCGYKWYRVRFCAEEKRDDSKGVNYYEQDHPRWSTSMGVPANQVNDFRKRFPNSTYSDDGKLYIKNRADKTRQRKERFMYEQD